MKYIIAALSATVLSGFVWSADAAGANKTAFDKRNNVVTNSFGNCVRTKWDAHLDICAPAPEPEPVPVVVPAPPPPPKIEREARTIYFDFDDATLTGDSQMKLDSLISHIKRSDAIVGAGIAGFADRMGTSDYNLELSKQRAKNVYQYLSQRVKINTQILDIRAVGDNAPQTDCDKKMKRTEKISCLAKDRRVEVVFKYQD